MIRQETAKIEKSITHTKRSLQYDNNKKFENLFAMLQANGTSATQMKVLEEIKASLGIEMPIKNDEAFMEFDSSLETDAEKRRAMVNMSVIVPLLRIVTYMRLICLKVTYMRIINKSQIKNLLIVY